MQSMDEIYQSYALTVYKYLLSLCRNDDLAEELTQETFFRAYMNFSSLRDKEKASVWLCQIAKNTYFAVYNENKKRNSYENDLSDENVEDAFIQKEISREALACLHQLEEPYKEVFMLSVFGGFSFKEISSLFGKSESWARVTFYRAKQKLSERIK